MKVLCTFSFLLVVSLTEAQQFGGFPSKTKWQQINSDTARIIFTPKAIEEANRVATIVHSMAANINPIGSKTGKIDIVLQSNTTLANGYVGLGPFRSEYYIVPGGNIFDFGNLPWAEQLALHEYRHVQQYNNFNRGLSKVAGYVLGQEGRALANALSVPDWFFEGDAVYAETVLTTQGRGRMPFFLNGYKSLWAEGRAYNWKKLRNGSLKDYVPDHYQLGYLLVNYGYSKYGPDFWRKVTTDAISFKGILYPFQKAIKKHSGVDFKSFRNEAFKFYSHEVSKKRDRVRSRETVTNYFFPQIIGEDSLLYMKSSYKSIPAFYVKTKGEEHKIKLRNITSEDWFSYRSGTIAYTSFNTNPRWSLENYSDIILLDIKTGIEQKITSKGRYFTPDISPDGGSLVTTFVTDSTKSQLHHLDINGKLMNSINAPADAYFIQPKFIDNHSVVVGLRWPDATLSMERIDLQTSEREVLIAPASATMGFPNVFNESVYFVSSFFGNDDIFQLRLSDRKLFQITTGQTGNYFPSVYGDSLTWSQFTSNGYRLMQKNLKDFTPIEISPSHLNAHVKRRDTTLNMENNILQLPSRDFEVNKYKKSTGLLNFHSWRPDYTAPEYRFTIYGNNILNTFSTEIFYAYNENELSHAVGVSTSYGGLFPVLRGGIDYTFNRHLFIPGRTITLNQSEVRVGYYIPLNFTDGKTFKFLNFGTDYVLNNLVPTGIYKDSIRSQTTTYLSHFVNWSQRLPKTQKQIFSRFGYALSGNYRHRLDEKGFQLFSAAQLNLPALFPTHNLVFNGNYQKTDTANVVFSNRFINSRGYDDFYFSRMWKGSANYHFPLLYPDRGVANIAYLLRVRSNLFFDYSRAFARNGIDSRIFRSAGTELWFDTKWWNQLPVTFGMRYSYLLDDPLRRNSRNVFEFVLPVNLIPD